MLLRESYALKVAATVAICDFPAEGLAPTQCSDFVILLANVRVCHACRHSFLRRPSCWLTRILSRCTLLNCFRL